jgi:hypothetical protein
MEAHPIDTLSERDVLTFALPFASIATTGASEGVEETIERRSRRETIATFPVARSPLLRPASVTEEHAAATSVSPSWLRRVKERIRRLGMLRGNWDSYGAPPVNPDLVPLAQDLVDWFAVDGIPPPDVFPTNGGGVQFEWHIRRVNVRIELSPFDETVVDFHDLLPDGQTWSRPVSDPSLQSVRRRLLVRP